MKALSVSSDREEAIQTRIRTALKTQGFTLVEKTHGNAYQSGWPDLMAFHPSRGVVWIECKRPDGKLRPSQRARFAEWEKGGMGVYVLDASSPDALAALQGPPNWRAWLVPKSKRSPRGLV